MRTCRVATRRFAEEGFAGVTLRGLASDLGCSPMTPYRYFENKEEIFHSVRGCPPSLAKLLAPSVTPW